MRNCQNDINKKGFTSSSFLCFRFSSIYFAPLSHLQRLCGRGDPRARPRQRNRQHTRVSNAIRIRTNLLKRERETQKFSNQINLKLSKMMFLRIFKLFDTVIHSCASKGESSSQHPVIPSFKSITMRPAIHCHS